MNSSDVVRLDSALWEELIRFTAMNHIKYPSIKSFVDQAIKEKLDKENK